MNNKHRHNWKDGKRVRIFGSTWHQYCADPNCDAFRVQPPTYVKVNP